MSETAQWKAKNEWPGQPVELAAPKATIAGQQKRLEEFAAAMQKLTGNLDICPDKSCGLPACLAAQEAVALLKKYPYHTRWKKS